MENETQGRGPVPEDPHGEHTVDAVPGRQAQDDDGASVAGEEPASSPTLGDVLLAAEELWPESLSEEWDKVGLVTGRLEQPVRRVRFAVDPTLEVIQEAVELGVDLLITHHPLLLRGVSSVAATTAKGRAIHLLIEHGIALLTVHTNGDSAVGGVSDVIADALELGEREPLTASRNGLPEEGIGRVGLLPEVVTLSDLAARLCGFLPVVAGGVRVAGERDALVRRVAICGGAGDSLFDDVRARQADVYITADLRHHPASEARETALGGRPYLIDVSHFASEWLWLPAAAQALDNVLEDQGFEVEIGVSSVNTDPWDFILTPHGDRTA
ncbi:MULTISPECIES: Nif3-like dinuclear metal center hexameric protein [Arthrobacter]|uniref:GTP cyclohydrolase 1 type 2 homolog n=2 Tax=Arthrobacter TaxID=1663 RepID=A0ABU9KFG5_9MICC|nr:Nif3-like dinuclear metal center hexameric protein [Arthrobacter sp. YJM1]MDP5225621.1 Nif3-like dinuclear metal center hexameric protein [Arthrobacter sp. YJM1]